MFLKHDEGNNSCGASSFTWLVEEVTATMSLSRGKLTGHDVDFLITHPEEGREVGLLPKVVSWLESQVNSVYGKDQDVSFQYHSLLENDSSGSLFLQGLLFYQKTTRNSYLESEAGPALPSSNMDRFERCFSIFKLEKKQGSNQTGKLTENGAQTLNMPDTNHRSQIHSGENSPGGAASRLWRAVRVDLVVAPISQFAFALLGWTGSKVTFYHIIWGMLSIRLLHATEYCWWVRDD